MMKHWNKSPSLQKVDMSNDDYLFKVNILIVYIVLKPDPSAWSALRLVVLSQLNTQLYGVDVLSLLYHESITLTLSSPLLNHPEAIKSKLCLRLCSSV